MENKYQNGKIYKITDNNLTKMYIGSTTKELLQRLSSHSKFYTWYLKGYGGFNRVYKLFKEFGFENCQISLLEAYPCNSKAELHRKEGEYILSSDCVNKNVAGRTQKEFYAANKERIKDERKHYYKLKKHIINERGRNYHYKNMEKIRDRRREYYCQNKDKFKEYRKQHKDKIKHRMKLYRVQNKDVINKLRRQRYKDNKENISQRRREHYQANKEKFKEYEKDYRMRTKDTVQLKKKEYVRLYYAMNKDKINKDKGVKFECPCGGNYTKSHQARHFKSHQHLDWLNNEDKDTCNQHESAIDNPRKHKIQCRCGGKYTISNQARHFKTQMHLKWLEENKTTENQINI